MTAGERNVPETFLQTFYEKNLRESQKVRNFAALNDTVSETLA